MIRFILSTLLLFLPILISANEEYIVRVWLADKDGCEFSTLQPEEFLSERSIQRHTDKGVEISYRDLPQTSQYKTEILNIAHRAICHSNWLNTIVVECDSSKIEEIEELPFVSRVEVLSPKNVKPVTVNPNYYNLGNVKRHKQYGVSYPISKIAGATPYHNCGEWGEGVYIAVLDDGFAGVDTLTEWFDKERIKFTCDLLNPNGNLYREDEHGTAVLSIMLANKEGEYVGVAPQSDYALLRTEDINHEAPYEEDFWIRGVEIADSLGVDIINSSLGYEDFNGITSVSTIAAQIAVEKGIVLVTSCGNKGEKGFSHPADVDGVVAVGGVDSKGKVLDFTSKRLVNGKYQVPKRVALASEVPVVNGSGKIVITYGTSFAAPAIAGVEALKRGNKMGNKR